MAKPPRKSRETRHTIVVNGQTLQVTSEERLRWVVCAGALSGDFPQMRMYWEIREANQLQSALDAAAPPSVITIMAPANDSVGEALNFLGCGVWEHRYNEYHTIKLNNVALSLSLKCPSFRLDLDEEKLLNSLHEGADLQPFLQSRSDQIVARKAERQKARQEAAEHVGYGSPPRAQRFKPGQSGWPKGRPRNTIRKDVIGEQMMPGSADRGRRVITVNAKVTERLESLAITNVRYLRLWLAVEKREKAWRDRQKRRQRKRIINIQVYEDIGDVICELGIASKHENDAVRGRGEIVKLCSWFVEEALKRSPDIIVGKAEAEILARSMAHPEDLQRCLAASGRVLT